MSDSEKSENNQKKSSFGKTILIVVIVVIFLVIIAGLIYFIFTKFKSPEPSRGSCPSGKFEYGAKKDCCNVKPTTYDSNLKYYKDCSDKYISIPLPSQGSCPSGKFEYGAKKDCCNVKPTTYDSNLKYYKDCSDKYTAPEPYTVGCMYGPFINNCQPVSHKMTIPSGKTVVMFNNGTYTKMVTTDNTDAGYFKGKISDVKPENWSSYKDPENLGGVIGKYLYSDKMITLSGPEPYTVGCMYGSSVIIDCQPVTHKMTIPSGKTVVMFNDGTYTKMVTTDNTDAGYFRGKIADVKPENWSSYKDPENIGGVIGKYLYSDKRLYRPIVTDVGYTDKKRGWYNLEGKGCYNYCRYVGDKSENYFSCMTAANVENKTPTDWAESNTPKDKWTESNTDSKSCLLYPYNYNVGKMYGDWIGQDKNVTNKMKINEPERNIDVVMYNDGTNTRMVTVDGADAKYFVGPIDRVKPENWKTYNDAKGKYQYKLA